MIICLLVHKEQEEELIKAVEIHNNGESCL